VVEAPYTYFEASAPKFSAFAVFSHEIGHDLLENVLKPSIDRLIFAHDLDATSLNSTRLSPLTIWDVINIMNIREVIFVLCILLCI
jgi:hypothetical protein